MTGERYCTHRLVKSERIGGKVKQKTLLADKFEAALQKLHDGLSKPRCEKKVAKLWERIGRLKEKNHGMGQPIFRTLFLNSDIYGRPHEILLSNRTARPIDALIWTHAPLHSEVL